MTLRENAKRQFDGLRLKLSSHLPKEELDEMIHQLTKEEYVERVKKDVQSYIRALTTEDLRHYIDGRNGPELGRGPRTRGK